MITLESYLKSGAWNPDSYALHHALENIKNSCLDVYKLNDIASDCYSTDIFKRLRVTVNFIKKAINLISEQQNPPRTQLRMRKDQRPRDFYDHFSDIMFEIILAASSVKAPPDNCWSIQHNTVWAEFFGLLGEGKCGRLSVSSSGVCYLMKYGSWRHSRTLSLHAYWVSA